MITATKLAMFFLGVGGWFLTFYPIMSIYKIMYEEEDNFPLSVLCGPVTQH